MQAITTVIIKRACVFLLLLTSGLLSGNLSANAAGQWRDGRQVYVKICHYCHDTNIGPVIKGTDKPVEYIRYIVRNGLRAMPAFRGAEIDENALKLLADYVKFSAPQ